MYWQQKCSVSDPCGSVLKWLPEIRLRTGNTDPDSGQSQWCHYQSFPVITGHSRSFPVILGHSRPFSVIPGHSRPFQVIIGLSRSFPIIPDHSESFLVICSHFWFPCPLPQTGREVGGSKIQSIMKHRFMYWCWVCRARDLSLYESLGGTVPVPILESICIQVSGARSAFWGSLDPDPHF